VVKVCDFYLEKEINLTSFFYKGEREREREREREFEFTQEIGNCALFTLI
jgi:hypothetical protein